MWVCCVALCLEFSNGRGGFDNSATPWMLNILVQVTDEEIKHHFPGYPITGTTREVYARSIRRLTGFDDFINLSEKRKPG